MQRKHLVTSRRTRRSASELQGAGCAAAACRLCPPAEYDGDYDELLKFHGSALGEGVVVLHDLLLVPPLLALLCLTHRAGSATSVVRSTRARFYRSCRRGAG